jgi:hypothetical protein
MACAVAMLTTAISGSTPAGSSNDNTIPGPFFRSNAGTGNADNRT